MIIEYFEPELLALRKEIEFHPDLLVILGTQTNPDIYIHITEIAAFLNIVLDGTYTKEDILKLCDVMTKKLFDKRSIIIHSGPTNSVH